MQEASADENSHSVNTPRSAETSPSEEIFHTDPSLHPDKQEPDLAIYPDDKISFDLAATVGVLFPSTDKNFFNKYYPKPTLDFELASNAIIWTADFGWSLGLKAIYAYNSQKAVDATLGSATQENMRYLYFGALELVAGVRYRNPHFLYLQPGIFAGAGGLRLREEGKALRDSGKNTADTKDQTMGVTQWSAVFDFGANLDISLATIFFYSERELDLSHDILLRLTALYRINPSRALDMSGLVLNAGFAFYFETLFKPLIPQGFASSDLSHTHL